ncbi:MAG: hypothetical protein QGD94_04520 [Planctomycetia bacterium]|nr:hypothetical protein [Planctomycetia bacterium]
MKRRLLATICLAALAATGCASGRYSYRESLYTGKVEAWQVLREFRIDPDIEERILALDPEHITEKDVREVLARAPAPRIINLHGGIPVVYLAMKSFSKFLIAMGYPEPRIRNPRDGSYSYSCYTRETKIAGIIAWYYEREGTRPMLIGHSQGGMQAVKVLHALAGAYDEALPPWNPITRRAENSRTIIDPLTGQRRPVVGVKVCYATAVGAGGATRFLPNQWKVAGKLRNIPDSVEEFTGFYSGMDFLGGDFLGFGPANEYASNGTAKVRNVKLPLRYNHFVSPSSKHLAESREIVDWINAYDPSVAAMPVPRFKAPSRHLLWAADVWHSVKKHWCIEAQRFLRARRKMRERNN